MRAATLRRATPADRDEILKLNADGNGGEIAEEMRIVFDHGGMAVTDYAVAIVDGRVVATVGLLATTLRVGAVTLPVGQPEYVATDPEHRGHGLAGRLLAMVQEWSDERGDLLQIITGVAYFYRQYGYSYGLARSPVLVVAPETAIDMPPGWQVRAAQTSDVDRIRALQAAAQDPCDAALPFADNLWAPFLVMATAPMLVAEHEGRVGAVARLRLEPGSPVHVQALAADVAVGVAGVQAVLAGARAGHPGATLVVTERPGSVVRAVVGAAAPLARHNSLYVRVPSLARLLRQMTAVLDQRLAASAFAAASGELAISLYRSTVHVRYQGGRIVGVSEGAPIHEPDDDDSGVGVPPDLVPNLVFGAGGAVALEGHPDVYLGRFRPLMDALFPPMRIDLLTW